MADMRGIWKYAQVIGQNQRPSVTENQPCGGASVSALTLVIRWFKKTYAPGRGRRSRHLLLPGNTAYQ